jgi:serine/threonine protein kinase
MAELRDGALFAGHRIEGVAGRGGMGVVYRARDLRLERLVALKVIAPELAERPEQRTRFISESRAAAALDHPSIVPLLYAGEEAGTPFIAMRFVEGPDLRTLVRRDGPLEPARAVAIVEQVAAALDVAHAHALIHRDVKPGNVLVGPNDRAYLTDFGLTKRLGESLGGTNSSDWVGTVDYVAPEMIRGLRVDHRADVYALGAALHFTLTGQPPFRRERDEAVLWAHVHDAPPQPSRGRPGLPAGFDDVVARAMAKDPERRYQHAGDLARAARSALTWADDSTQCGTRTRVMPRLVGTSHGPRRRPAVTALAVLLAAGTVTALALREDPSPPAPAAASTTPGPAPTAVSRRPRLVARVPVSERPSDIAVTPRRVWVTSAHATTLAGLDPRSAQLVNNRGGYQPGSSGAAVGFETLWVINRTTNTLIALHPHRHTPQHTITVPPGPQAVEAGLGHMWVLTSGDPNVLVKVDPRRHAIVATATLPVRSTSYLAVGHGAVFVSNVLSDRLFDVDPDTLQVRRSVLAGAHPRAIAVGRGGVWVAVPPLDSVLRFNYRLTRSRPIHVGRRPHVVTAGPAGVWASNLAGGTVQRIDPERARRQGKPVRVGNGPFAMTSSRHRLWVTLIDDNAVARVDVP